MNPIILYDNRFNDAIPTATDTAAGYDVLNIRDLRTYTFHKFTGSGTKYYYINCGSGKTADCLAIISHNLGTAGATVSVESSATGAWTGEQVERLAGFVPTSDKALLKTFNSATAQFWRVKIVTAAVAAQVGVLMLGTKLLFPYPPDTPYRPYSERIEANTSLSKTGNILGSTIRYYPIDVVAPFSNLTRTWVLDNFKPFWINHGRKLNPFFYAWDLDVYPDDVLFLACSPDMVYELPVSVLAYIDSIILRMQGVSEV
ncbi:MAG: hypothetical protein AB1553_00620 [Nitrospirota bacterium]